MITAVSPKYQIVIPKAVRKQLNIKPGQKMRVDATADGTIIVTQAGVPLAMDELHKYAGSLQSKKRLGANRGSMQRPGSAGSVTKPRTLYTWVKPKLGKCEGMLL
jgi:AbrB family looped-hinge helix DNA binding protein